MRASRTLFTAAALALALGAAGCGSNSDSAAPAKGGSTASTAQKKGSVTIGAFNFGESAILANMYAKVLEKAGYQVTVKSLTNREVVEPALEKGDLDVVPEYVGTLTEFLNKKTNGKDAAPKASGELAATMMALTALAEPRGLVVLTPSPAADQNAFAVSKDFASKNKLTTLSDLSSFQGPLVLGGPAECPTRPFCQPGLEKTYGLKFSGFKSLDAGGPLTKQAIQKGDVQIGLVFSSDAGIEALGLQVLQDDKKLQTVDNIVPVVNKSKISDDLRAVLDKVSAALTTDELVALNKKVDVDRADPAKVAADFLQSKGLI